MKFLSNHSPKAMRDLNLKTQEGYQQTVAYLSWGHDVLVNVATPHPFCPLAVICNNDSDVWVSYLDGFDQQPQLSVS